MEMGICFSDIPSKFGHELSQNMQDYTGSTRTRCGFFKLRVLILHDTLPSWFLYTILRQLPFHSWMSYLQIYSVHPVFWNAFKWPIHMDLLHQKTTYSKIPTSFHFWLPLLCWWWFYWISLQLSQFWFCVRLWQATELYLFSWYQRLMWLSCVFLSILLLDSLVELFVFWSSLLNSQDWVQTCLQSLSCLC